MKTVPRLLITVIALTTLSTAGCAEKEQLAVSAPPAPAVPPGPAQIAAVATPWTDLKNYTYEQRDPLLGGLKALFVRVDEQIRELNARHGSMLKNNVDTADWDFAMKEMSDARSNLNSAAEELGKARRENWDQQKDAFGRAWLRTQEAYAKVKSSTTS